MKDNINGAVGKETADKGQIFLVPDALCHVKHIKNYPVGRCPGLAMKEIGDIAYLLVMAERKRIRENSTEIIIFIL